MALNISRRRPWPDVTCILRWFKQVMNMETDVQDSLGGSSSMALIVCCSPAAEDAAESLSALRFGARAAGIVNTPQANTMRKGSPAEEAAKALEATQVALASCFYGAIKRSTFLAHVQIVWPPIL